MSSLYTRFQYGFLDLSGNPSRLVQYPIKNLNLGSKSSFLFISSIFIDLCDHVKILRCLNRKWIVDKEDLPWIVDKEGSS
jgi:hypothetical protein